jgi:hypothetical protein
MTREFTSHTSKATEGLLATLVDEGATPAAYQAAMTGLGKQLAERIVASMPAVKSRPICVVCTVEDADFLARGILEGLETAGVNPAALNLVCFWNERVRAFNNGAEPAFDVAPIIKAYREDFDLPNAVVIVVKSIISGACVVKTNLTALINRTVPEEVLVAAPVILKGAEKRLASEFPAEMASKFKYFTFAIDDTKSADGEVVLPGIGGSVYDRLGFTDKNAHVPEIVKMRRRSRFGTAARV